MDTTEKHFETAWASPKGLKTPVINDSADHISELAMCECGMRVLPPGTVLIVVPEGLRTDLWKRLRLFMPPLSEQRQICEWVAATSSCFDALIAKVRRQISKFQEYRTALISAAVTGRIDVRASTITENLLT